MTVPQHSEGFSAAELLVVVAVIGVLFSVSIPFFVSAYQTSAARADVQQVISIFNQARELAIMQNNNVCVSVPNATHVVFMLNGCAGTAWVGAGTDASGNINLPQGFTIGPLSSVTFTYLGAATAATTYTMTNSTTGGTMTISIALSGRVRTP
jgi:prepilin-type N-terminal cleavage/methylation domain-containing protein